jgi:membrane protein DedA with SNARE-associated domain
VGCRGHFETAHDWFERYGFWATFAAGFTPSPCKVFTIAAGAAHMALVPFTLGSLVGRGARLAGLVRWGGAPIEHHIRGSVEGIGWATLLILYARVHGLVRAAVSLSSARYFWLRPTGPPAPQIR